MSALANLTKPNSVKIHLETLTPLYTGGIGQYGEQIHPAGLLGSLRHFSCLAATAVGNKTFATNVWGETGQAKQVALQWDISQLKKIPLPSRIGWQDGAHKHRGWFFNEAKQGSLTLTVSRRGLSQSDWQLLILALRIQIRCAMLGAKDQFGLGIVKAEELPTVSPLTENQVRAPLTDTPNLDNAFFADIQFPCPAPDLRECLEIGLRWRAHLRACFRSADKTKDTKLRKLRHYLFGDLRDKFGSAINVSAVYPLNKAESALRIWGVLPHTKRPDSKKNQRGLPIYETVIKTRNPILTRLENALNDGPKKHCQPTLNWQTGSNQNIAAWLNELAGMLFRE